jgi:multidrug efflux pump subunit AcrB
LTRLSITPQQLAQAIDAQNTVAPVGTITTADDRVFVRPSGAFKDVQALADMLITVNRRTFRLGDIATVRSIAQAVSDKVRADPRTRNVQFDWDEQA